MPLETFPYDSAEYLNTREAMAAYLQETLASGDPEDLADSLEVLARAGRMHGIALGEDAVCAPAGLPVLLSVVKALGLRLSVQTPQHAEAA